MRLLLQQIVLAALVLVALAPHRASASAKDRFLPQLVASSFVRALLNGHLQVAAPLCAPRVNFDGHWVEEKEPIRQALSKLMTRARRARLRLKTVHVLSHSEMIKRYGAPPPRLAKAMSKRDVFALVRFSRLGLVIGLERQGRLYRIKLLSD